MRRNILNIKKRHYTYRLKSFSILLIFLVVFNSTNIFNLLVYGQNTDVDSLREEIVELTDRIESLKIEIKVPKAFSLFRRNLIKPGNMLSNEIIDKVYDQWVITLSEQLQNIAQKSKTVIKKTLASIIDQKIKRLYWYENGWDNIDDNKYKMYMMTQISIIDVLVPGVGTIKIADVTINVSGSVDVEGQIVSNVVVESVQVFDTDLQEKGGIPGFTIGSIILGLILASVIFHLSKEGH